MRNFGEGYRPLIQQQPEVFEAANPGVTLPQAHKNIVLSPFLNCADAPYPYLRGASTVHTCDDARGSHGVGAVASARQDGVGAAVFVSEFGKAGIRARPTRANYTADGTAHGEAGVARPFLAGQAVAARFCWVFGGGGVENVAEGERRWRENKWHHGLWEQQIQAARKQKVDKKTVSHR